MPGKPLNRRTFLRGMLGGAAVAIGLPPLEAFFDVNGRAYAATGALPTRFGLFFWGNGILPDRWIPESTGSDWALSPLLSPLSAVQQHVSVITGLEVKVENFDAHESGPAGFLSGSAVLNEAGDHTFAGPSIDQLIAAELGGGTRFRSLEVGVQPGVSGRSYNGPKSRNPPETEPGALFARLFGQGFTAPGDEPVFDPRLALRRSVLDTVLDDADALRKRLGASDRVRLEQHLASVRDLENRIALLESDPPKLDACLAPAAPPAVPDIEGRPDMSTRARLIADLVTMAYACDLTRVMSFWYSDPLSDVLYPDASAGHHQLTHDEPGNQPRVAEIVTSIMGDLGYLLASMAAVQEGDGTLLDHSVVLGTTDVSYGRTHQIDEFPILVAGTAGGALVNGMHYRSTTKENASMVPLSILRAMGLARADYGEAEARTTKGLGALEAS